MYELVSTQAMSSMRPPMLAGPMPRKMNRLSIGSLDQLIGVGVGLGVGVDEAAAVADGDWAAAGVCVGTGFSALTANVPSVTAIIARAQIAVRSPATSRAERHVCFIGEIPFKAKLWLEAAEGSCRRK